MGTVANGLRYMQTLNVLSRFLATIDSPSLNLHGSWGLWVMD
jgi:hypothetical protein